jgi:hypothetical protein
VRQPPSVCVCVPFPPTHWQVRFAPSDVVAGVLAVGLAGAELASHHSSFTLNNMVRVGVCGWVCGDERFHTLSKRHGGDCGDWSACTTCVSMSHHNATTVLPRSNNQTTKQPNT